MAEQHRLRLLQVRVAGHHDAEMLLGQTERARDGVDDALREVGGHALGVQARVGGDLVVAAAARVEARPGGTDSLGEHALDGHVDVLVLDAPLELARLNLAEYLGEARLDRICVGLGDDALLCEHAGVRDRAADVLGPHALVDRQRGAELLQERPRGLLETSAPGRLGVSHLRPAPWASGVRRRQRPAYRVFGAGRAGYAWTTVQGRRAAEHE